MTASIVVVDDTPLNLDLLAGILAGQGYRIRTHASGAAALAAVNDDPPDLVLLDAMMPEMDGYEVCRRLAGDARTKGIPVLFISALEGTLDKVKAFEAGAVDYLTKPFEPEEVLARVRTHLSLKQSRQELERANADLKQALEEVRTLKGLLPICANCKRIRKDGHPAEDQASWVAIESYIRDRTGAQFSHGICPKCSAELYSDLPTPRGG